MKQQQNPDSGSTEGAQQPQEEQQAQIAPTAQEAYEALTSLLTHEELEHYKHSTISEIEQLPPPQREQVWHEIAKGLFELPEFSDMMNAAIANIQNFARLVEEWQNKTAILDGIYAAHSDSIADEELIATLAPYINAEADEHPEKYGEHAENPARFPDLIAAAAARARADGKEIPRLALEKLTAEQLEMDLVFESAEEKESSPTAEPKTINLARDSGAITTLGGHAATLADKDNKALRYIFTNRNMMELPGEHDKFLFDNTGKLMDFSLNGQKLQPLDDIHTGFLMVLLQIANLCDIREYNSKDNPSVALHLPTFFRETEIDPRQREREYNPQTGKKELTQRRKLDNQTMKQLRLQKFIEFMKPLDNRVGIIEGEGYYTVARFLSWDEQTDTAFIAIPYEIKLAEMARLHADKHSAISTIFRANIATEKPQAVELSNMIAVGVIERGVTRSQTETYKNSTPRKPIKIKTTKSKPDGSKETVTEYFSPEKTITKAKTDDEEITATVTRTGPKPGNFEYSIRFDTLIAQCPQLQSELEAIRNSTAKDKSQRINKKLKDTFAAAIRIIMEKSEMPEYYANLEIKTKKFNTFKAPTNSTLSGKLVVTHNGKNPNYAG